MEKRLLVLLLAIGTLLLLEAGPMSDRGDLGELQLERPSLVALAATGGQEGANLLQQEAGIAAYLKVDQTIDIPRLRAAFKVVEQLSDDYLTGQIAIPNLEENFLPRAFVSRDGWIVAYYPYQEPTSEMLALWVRSTSVALTGTTLELAITRILGSAGISAPAMGIKYYHFRYPAANRIMLIREDTQGQDWFYLTIPAALRVFDATWIGYLSESRGDYDWAGIKVDDKTIFGGNRFQYQGVYFGNLLSELGGDVRHVISVWRGNYGIVLLYQAP